MRILVSLLMCALTFGAVPAMAAPSAPESQFIESLGQRALSILADKTMTRDQSLNQFKDMLNKDFDLPTIGKFVLGRYWRVATPAEQDEYLKLFNTMVEKIYTDRFSLYSGEQFSVTSSRVDTGKDKIVTSQIVRPQGGPPVNVEWRVREQDKAGTFKIVDVIVEGVSMSVTQRAEFSSVIQRGGGQVATLLDMMRQKAAQPDAPLPNKS